MPRKKTGNEKIYKRGKIYKYDNDGNYICEFESYQICCDLEDISAGHLWDILNYGKTKRIKGFIYTYDYYIKYPIDEKLIILPRKGTNQKNLYQYDLNGNFIRKWESIAQASKELKINRSHLALASKSNFTRQGCGYLWSRKFVKKTRKFFKKTKGNIIEQYSLNGKLIATFKSGSEAEKLTGINRFSLYHCCSNRQKTAGGFIWKYKDNV